MLLVISSFGAGIADPLPEREMDQDLLFLMTGLDFRIVSLPVGGTSDSMSCYRRLSQCLAIHVKFSPYFLHPLQNLVSLIHRAHSRLPLVRDDCYMWQDLSRQMNNMIQMNR